MNGFSCAFIYIIVPVGSGVKFSFRLQNIMQVADRIEITHYTFQN